MNYYIQGDAANADKINAAFEKLGYDTTGHLFNAKSVLYFTLDGGIRATTCNCTPAIIKTHPGYKELELPVEPKFKFKVGDWIVQNDNGTVSQITKTINGKDEYGEYRAYEHTNGYFAACFENEYHLWTIQDAKEGDVLAINNTICIFKKLDKDGYYIISPCIYTVEGVLEIISDENDTIGSCGFKPATKEQRDQFFAKIKEAGYQWDYENKELRKIHPHYDISNFKPFQKVLRRGHNRQAWRPSLYGFYDTIGKYPMFVCATANYLQCIPFEGNEHLLGTSDPCDEMYINW